MIINISFFPSVHFINKKITMSPQSHNNIIWHPNLINIHIFLSTFVDNNAIQFTFFFELFDKLLDSKKKSFFWNYLF